MNSWATNTGGRVTAPTRADAERLAEQYGLGEITGPAAPTPKAARVRLPADLVVWDDLCQVVRAEGATALHYWTEERTEGEPAELWIRGPRGPRRPTTEERRQIYRLLRDAAE